jgi:hypothetical protein
MHSKAVSKWRILSEPVAFNNTLFTAFQVEAAFLDELAFMFVTLETINSGPYLQTMHRNEWKKRRNLFNPDFVPGYITGLAQHWRTKSWASASCFEVIPCGEMFQLE